MKKITFTHWIVFFSFFFLSTVLLGKVTSTDKGGGGKGDGTSPVVIKAVDKTPEMKLGASELLLKKDMVQLFEDTKQINSADSSAREKSRQSLRAALDWDKVAQICLGKNEWKKQAAGNRNAFRDLLKEIMLLSAYNRLDKFWGEVASYQFKKISVKGSSEGYAAADFEVGGEVFGLEYYFTKKGGKWFIDDIAYEEMKYSENINEQITAFLKEGNFNTLLNKLRKRKKELLEEVQTPPSKAEPKKS